MGIAFGEGIGGFAVREPRRCAFVEDRPCNFEADQISMDFCMVCIDAWKASGGAQSGAQSTDKSKEKLAQIDRLFQNGGLEPEDYIRLRKSLMGDQPATEVEAKPSGKGFHLLLVERKMFSKQVRTFPGGWKLPPTMTGKLVESLYQMCDSAEKPTGVRLEVGETKMACLAREGGRLAVMVTDDDFAAYQELMTSVGVGLVDSEDWEDLLRVAASGQE
jgi:hypothetical protein